MTWRDQIFQLRNKIMDTPRLLISAMLIVILVWFLALSQLMDWADDAERDYALTYKKLTQTQQLSQEDFWEERKQQSSDLLSRLESRLWPIQNEGLARATLQNDITQIAEQSGLEKLRIQIEKSPASKNNKDFVKFTASVTAWFKPEALEKFFTDIAKNEHLILIDSLEVKFKPFPYLKTNLSVLMPQTNTKPGVKNKDGGKL